MKKTVRPLVIANWKMNPQSLGQATRLVTEVREGLSRRRKADVVIAPPSVFLQATSEVRNGSKLFSLGAQDVHWEKLGARTGEVSVPMLKSFGVTHVIVGHSERRAMGESDDVINKKVRSVIKEGIVPVVCVGEKKRDNGAHYLSLVENQVRRACATVSKAKLQQLVIAYEPIWAIGTGDTATPEDAHEMSLFIHKVLADVYGRSAGEKVKVLYGGSVNARNAKALMDEGMVDGFLVGGASLRAEEFVTIIREAT